MLEQSTKPFKISLILLAIVGAAVFSFVTCPQLFSSFLGKNEEIIQPLPLPQESKESDTPVSTIRTVPPTIIATTTKLLTLTEAQLEIRSIQEQVRTGAISKTEGERQMLELIQRMPPTTLMSATTTLVAQ